MDVRCRIRPRRGTDSEEEAGGKSSAVSPEAREVGEIYLHLYLFNSKFMLSQHAGCFFARAASLALLLFSFETSRMPHQENGEHRRATQPPTTACNNNQRSSNERAPIVNVGGWRTKSRTEPREPAPCVASRRDKQAVFCDAQCERQRHGDPARDRRAFSSSCFRPRMTGLGCRCGGARSCRCPRIAGRVLRPGVTTTNRRHGPRQADGRTRKWSPCSPTRRPPAPDSPNLLPTTA